MPKNNFSPLGSDIAPLENAAAKPKNGILKLHITQTPSQTFGNAKSGVRPKNLHFF